MRTIKGPAIFLAQFLGEHPPFNALEPIAKWAADLGFLGLQVPVFDDRLIDLRQAAESEAYADEITAMLAGHGIVITELASQRLGHLVAIHPAYDPIVDVFAPPELRGRPAARQAWALERLLLAAKASKNLGLERHVTFSGNLLWPFLYPYPPRPSGLVEDGFAELARRWRPILNAFDGAGCDLCFELHPGEDLHDGATFERFLDVLHQHSRCQILYDPAHLFLQQIDYLDFLDRYRERIQVVHLKDAEFRRNGRTGTYGGYLGWSERAGRFRSLGDGQIDFGGIFTRLADNDYPGWAVLEWECALKHPEDGASEGAAFIRDHIIRVTERPFDAPMMRRPDSALNRRALGLD
jgi:sugar phosphate isomerase/epimerase